TSNRDFQLWDYTVTHKQLLLRSPRGPNVADNIDIVFWSVRYLNLQTALRGLAIDLASTQDAASVEAIFGGAPDVSVIRIDTSEKQFFIAAGGFRVLQNDRDIFDSTLCYMGDDRPIESCGKELVR